MVFGALVSAIKLSVLELLLEVNFDFHTNKKNNILAKI